MTLNDLSNFSADPVARIRGLLEGFIPGERIGSFVNGEVLEGKGPQLDLTDPATGKGRMTGFGFLPKLEGRDRDEPYYVPETDQTAGS